jgi:hypothetical protein
MATAVQVALVSLLVASPVLIALWIARVVALRLARRRSAAEDD